VWHVSLFQIGLAIMLLAASWILIVRRRREAREGITPTPASRGGSPLWLWIVIAAWAGGSLLAAITLLLTGHAVIDY
jgi:hypothetical protein